MARMSKFVSLSVQRSIVVACRQTKCSLRQTKRSIAIRKHAENSSPRNSLHSKHKQQNHDSTSFDTSSISNSVETEISGILGFSTLGLLDVNIDYRDGLVDFTFDQQKWCRGACR